MAIKRSVVGGIVGVVCVVGAALAVIVGGGGSGVPNPGHQNIALDASSSTTLPADWSSGYTRTGAICYTQDATETTSACFAANVVPYTTDATDVAWAVELAMVNRLPTNVSGACGGAPWVCTTATMDSTSADPAGGTTASTVTFGGGSIDATAFGYTNSAALDLRLWAKCPGAGTLAVTHQGSTGSWTVDATAMGTGWNLLHTAAAEVTEVTAFESDGSGGLRLRLSGVDCSLWHMTATEVASPLHHSTIPTTDATGSTVGVAAWTIDNSSGAYWAPSGVAKVETKTVNSGLPCWVYSGSTIKLTGASGCRANWYALSLTWSD